MSREQKIHFVFVISLMFKAVFAFLETLGGFAAYAIAVIGNIFGNSALQSFLVSVAALATQAELSEDPRDFVANYLLSLAQTISTGSLNFVGIYLLIHGVVKLWLIIGLLRKKLWYYPTALVVFVLFIAYQLYRYSFTHSPLLLAITAVDLVVIALTWHEYKYLRNNLA